MIGNHGNKIGKFGGKLAGKTATKMATHEIFLPYPMVPFFLDVINMYPRSTSNSSSFFVLDRE
jgi:hypothetical protein